MKKKALLLCKSMIEYMYKIKEELKMSKTLSLSKYKNFIRSLNLSSDDLIKRYNVMNHMVIEEIKNANNKKVVNFLKKRRQFLADEAMRMIVSKEVA